MAHEIESMVWTGARPWHNLGRQMDHLMMSHEALVEGGLDWHVMKQPMYVAIPDDGMVQADGVYATVRLTDGKILGTGLGEQYTPVQNEDAFQWMDSLIGEGQAQYETAGSLRGGQVIFLTVKIPTRNGLKDEHEDYLVLTNSHDSTRRLMALATKVRVVCMNTLNMSTRSATNKITLRHTKSINDRLDQAREVFKRALFYFGQLDEHLILMQSIQVTDQQKRAYVEGLFPKVQVEDERLAKVREAMKGVSSEMERNLLETVLAKTELMLSQTSTTQSNIDKILELSETGKGIPQWRGTAYGLLNAVIEYADHWSRGKQDESKRMESIWMGSISDFKQRAYDQLEQVIQLAA